MSAHAGGAPPRRHFSASALSPGNLLYLASVGLVAIATIGVFFGTGLFLLVPPAGGTISGSAARSLGTEVRSLSSGLLPPTRSGQRSPEGKLGPVAITTQVPPSGEATSSSVASLPPRPMTEETPRQEEDGAPQSSTALAATLETLQGGRDDSPPEVQVAALPAEAAHRAPAPSAAVPDPASSALAAPTPATPNLRLSAAEISELLTRGDARLQTGDVASARLFYERAAAAGDGRAALRLGATFDPAFLGHAGLRNVRGDAAEARSWYSRALDLGAAEAQRQLNGLETQKGR